MSTFVQNVPFKTTTRPRVCRGVGATTEPRSGAFRSFDRPVPVRDRPDPPPYTPRYAGEQRRDARDDARRRGARARRDARTRRDWWLPSGLLRDARRGRSASEKIRREYGGRGSSSRAGSLNPLPPLPLPPAARPRAK